MQDDGLSLDPVKYEKYYNYIQRIKAIHESRVAEQKDIDEKYEGKIGFYNGKLKVLKRFYAKEQNINPLLQISINKAFQVVYGKPVFKNMKYDKKNNKVYGILHIVNIYNVDKYKDKKIEFSIKEKNSKKFLKVYDNLKVKIQFDYKENSLYLKDCLFVFKNEEYIASFIKKTNEKVKTLQKELESIINILSAILITSKSNLK